MRIAAVALLAAVAIPVHLEAQIRRGPIRRPPPSIPPELPPAAPSVEKVLAYRRARLAIETYPFVNVNHSAVGSTWITGGFGSHAEYRFTPWVLGSLDLTVSSRGEPATSETAELGIRVMTDRIDARTRPYADVRAGFMRTDDPGFVRSSGTFPGYASQGLGGVVGGGMHHDISRSFSLVTGASIMHGRLSSTGPVVESSSYSFTSYRFTLGLRYNRVRQVHTAAQPR